MAHIIQQMAVSVKSWSSGILQLKVGIDMNASLLLICLIFTLTRLNFTFNLNFSLTVG